MDNLNRLQQQASTYIAAAILFSNFVIIALVIFGNFSTSTTILVCSLTALVLAFLIARLLASKLMMPLQLLWQTVLYLATDRSSTLPSLPDDLKFGRELLTSTLPQLFRLASMEGPAEQKPMLAASLANQTLTTLPLPIIVISSKSTVSYANEAAAVYLGFSVDKAIGADMNDILHLLFPSEQTYERWLSTNRQNTITGTKTWERVRVTDMAGNLLHQCDLVSYFNKGLGEDVESTLVFFDRTERYSQDDQDIGFVALAVHELRTPLTVMRGYVEVFERELKGQLDGEMVDFMDKLSASTQQLSTFVSNILNVARIEGNQLSIRLEQQNWPELLHMICNNIEMRVRANGKHLEFNIHSGIAPVAVDKVSIYEVIDNLVDNAIKYSPSSNRIIISARQRNDGSVETTVQDFGVGIPRSALSHLFTKFYRSHRSRNQFAGTGLGLYLCKSIVEAHGGEIWVQSKEGEGSTFGFTLKNYTEVASGPDNDHNGAEIIRSAHGWIKNHSLYRD